MEKKIKTSSKIYAKIERYNPFGSIKDRVAINIIENAEKEGYLTKNTSIVEATSGNLGISLATIGKIKGYKCKIIMPENMSEKRKELIRSYGAELILTSANLGIKGAIQKAKNISSQIKLNYYADQFHNYSSVEAHFKGTAPEIYKQLEKNIDIIIAGIGTGGTIAGMYSFFKNINSKIQIIGVLPTKLPHKIQGIGAGFSPPLLNKILIDDIIFVGDEEAFLEMNKINEIENIGVGISSGAVLAALKKLLVCRNYYDKNIVLIFPDGVDRY